ncbi:DoxX family membrane protein [Iningainema tapete]|uniref:DoxX family membrane protein n=1 Tax=Iningainema tapete BLCC-T55 TaxID=2748662 RepID=A0A8J7CF49_9CYAN|nr:DoxX family membrane protein [Iningainema tapete]MBD2774330.1 DoxX family membrane protein [Iningainema tapete BLCC-T55]
MAGSREIWVRHRDAVLAYTFLRLVFGVNFFNHGLTRIGNIPKFVESMVGMYKDTFVPAILVRVPAYVIPPLELAIGLLLILGLATRGALIAGFCLMIVLMSGVTLLQQWDTATSQLIYCLVFFVLLALNSLNTVSVDHFRQRRNRNGYDNKT